MSRYSVCVDASFIIRVLVGPDPARYRVLWRSWQAERAEVVSPVLLFYELANVLHRQTRANLLAAETARGALETALAMPIVRVTDVYFHRRAMRLAEDLALPAAYDAHYLAVAEAYNCELWTTDKRLASAASKAAHAVRLM